MREIRKESEVAVFCSSDQAAGKCFERGRYIASHTDVLRAGVGHAFLPHGGADTRDEPLRMSAWEASRYIIPFSRIPRFNFKHCPWLEVDSIVDLAHFVILLVFDGMTL